jgi:heme-degrading monooxygenase HmoA
MFANTPPPPYYAVIFTNMRKDASPSDGYADMATEMVHLAEQQEGYLGHESVRGADGMGITVSYWASEAHIVAWKANARHQFAQQQEREQWYEGYFTRVAKVDRDYRI